MMTALFSSHALLPVLGIFSFAHIQVDCAIANRYFTSTYGLQHFNNGADAYGLLRKSVENRLSQPGLTESDQLNLNRQNKAKRKLPKHHVRSYSQNLENKISTAFPNEGDVQRNSSNSRVSGGVWSFHTETPNEESTAPGPSFDNSTASIVTAVIGRTAFLPCTVRNLGDRTVSWIRRADLSVLSVGRDRYIQDRRFQVMASATGLPLSSWALQLAYPSPGDSGVYECQLGSVPKISRHVTLRVIARTARIWGGPQLYVNSGSGVNLTCQLTGVAEPSRQQIGVADTHTQYQALYASSWSNRTTVQDGGVPGLEPSVKASVSTRKNGAILRNANSVGREETASHVFWYHNGEVVNYEHMKIKGDSSRGIDGARGLVDNGNTTYAKQDPVVMMSVLRIRHARASHSGNYSCAPSDALPAHITLHVLHGEHPPAAMQDPQPSGATKLITAITGPHRSPSLWWSWQRPLVGFASLAHVVLVLYAASVVTPL
ncbi:uncharacterized protein LOC111248754 isoform X1 [Varroa destructor]|uniref:Ig-like domain-containing protein n=1 Tax=Varroa destructor TaxID=109461 RepID=A0A7M7JV41_VARDE|nr:uncharacterized protein LOC111248754 isoform X1 [Varroa destructor]